MIHFVGAGPGDPELITVRGARLLANADCVIYAGSLVNPQLLEMVPKDCSIFNSAHMTLEDVIEVMAAGEAAHESTVRLPTGDPSLYGAIREQMASLDELGISYDVTPGVSSFCGAAASLNLEYTLPSVSQSVVITRLAGRTPVPEGEELSSWAAHGATMVVFLSAGMLEQVQEQLLAGAYIANTPAALVYRASWPDEKVVRCTVGTLAESARKEGIFRTALVVVGDVLDGPYDRSLLYDPTFTTGYREAKAQ